jgi:hypothetical protein
VISAQVVATRVKRDWRWLAWWAPLLFVAAYAIALVVNFRGIITAINRNGDAVIALIIGKLWGRPVPRARSSSAITPGTRNFSSCAQPAAFPSTGSCGT